MTFPVALGATIARSDLHDLLGGRLSTRISPSSVTDNIFAFTSPGRPDSRLDGWTGETDQHFHFTGEGRPGVDHTDGGATALWRGTSPPDAPCTCCVGPVQVSRCATWARGRSTRSFHGCARISTTWPTPMSRASASWSSGCVRSTP